jgi:hypothetical protein
MEEKIENLEQLYKKIVKQLESAQSLKTILNTFSPKLPVAAAVSPGSVLPPCQKICMEKGKLNIILYPSILIDCSLTLFTK